MPPKRIIESKLTQEQQEMVLSVDSMAYYIAHKYMKFINCTIGREDLYAAGIYGACIASQNFKPELGIKFSTYAYEYMNSEIRKEVVKGFGFKIPLGIAYSTPLPLIYSVDKCADGSSYNPGVNEGRDTFGNTLPSNYTLDHLETYLSHQDFIMNLDNRVFHRYVLNMGFDEIARVLGCTRQAVQQSTLIYVRKMSKKKLACFKEVIRIGKYICPITRNFKYDEGVGL
ncbi:MAG: hypothetical protein ACRCX2_21620 [Paraclostridium sp.]